MLSPSEREPVDDFAVIPIAPRKSDENFSVHFLKPNIGYVGQVNLDSDEYKGQERECDWLNGFDLPEATTGRYCPPNDILKLFQGPTVQVSLHLNEKIKSAVRSVRRTIEQMAGMERTVTISKVCQLSMTFSLIESDKWIEKALPDGRLSTSRFSLTGTTRRTTVVISSALIREYQNLTELQQACALRPPSLESVKTTGLAYGLTRMGEWPHSWLTT